MVYHLYMLTFTYNKHWEKGIFNDWENKESPFYQLLTKELEIAIPQEFTDQLADKITNDWLEYQEKFLNSLGKFYEKELIMPNITAYLIRGTKMPYNYKVENMWFACPLFTTRPDERIFVAMHELVHFFQPVELPRLIKEAIPVILKDKEAFGIGFRERGHDDEEEQEWRKKIWKLYQDEGKFSDLVNLAK